MLTGDKLTSGNIVVAGYVAPNTVSTNQLDCGVLFTVDRNKNDYGDAINLAFSDGTIDIDIKITVAF